MRSDSIPERRVAWFAAAVVGLTGSAWAIVIDNPPPAFDDPPSPWVSLADQPVITYAFKTSWDGITWSPEQKAIAYDAINTLDQAMPLQVFEETGDFTIRFAGDDFFRDWRDAGAYNHPGWDLTNPLAVAYKHNNGPWDHSKYPNNEIYINSRYPWSYSLTSVDPNAYDFWTVLLHEVIHMLACDAHATDPDEVMYESIGMGVRKTLKESDYDILRRAGYTIPEPSLAGVIIGVTVLLSRRTRAA